MGLLALAHDPERSCERQRIEMPSSSVRMLITTRVTSHIERPRDRTSREAMPPGSCHFAMNRRIGSAPRSRESVVLLPRLVEAFAADAVEAGFGRPRHHDRAAAAVAIEPLEGQAFEQ